MSKIGDSAFNFKLKGIDGKSHALSEFSKNKSVVIFFTCNHCPYVNAYEDRIIKLQDKFKNSGVQFIGINSNDAQKYPDDSFENMVKRSKDKGFNFPYLHDHDQAIAKAYNAACTPEFYLFDEKQVLRYHGKLDDNWKEPENVKQRYLQDAIESLLSNSEIKTKEATAIGCSIKWK